MAKKSVAPHSPTFTAELLAMASAHKANVQSARLADAEIARAEKLSAVGFIGTLLSQRDGLEPEETASLSYLLQRIAANCTDALNADAA